MIKTGLSRGAILAAVILLLLAALLPTVRTSYASTAICDGITFEIEPDVVRTEFESRVTVSNSGTAFDTSAFPDNTWIDIVGAGPGRLDPDPDTNTTGSIFTVTIPAGIRPGTYDVTIRNLDTADVPDGFCEIPSGLRVNGPEAPQLDDEDEDETETPTSTPLPTQFVRPLVLAPSYGASTAVVVPGQDFEIQVNLRNDGQLVALNVVADFVAGELEPRQAGGVLADTRMEVGEATSINQILTVNDELLGDTVSITMEVTYSDEFGTEYMESFLLVFDLNDANNRFVTATPTVIPPSQILVTSYETDLLELTPGTIFTLDFVIQNLGRSDATDVTMVLGSTGADPNSGGIAGASGTFENFAPVGASNVQRLGSIPINDTVEISQQLVVNTTTAPGAYPLTVSFVYTDSDNNLVTDSQIVTLLVLRPPEVDISFYRTPAPFVVGEQTVLPIQIANLGQSVSLGNLRVMSDTAIIENNSTLIGQLDSGSFFTFDAGVTPEDAGTIRIVVAIDYTDDFGTPQSIERTFNFEVADNPDLQVSIDEETTEQPLESELESESFGGVVVRFFRGIFGLDSARQSVVDQDEPDSNDE